MSLFYFIILIIIWPPQQTCQATFPPVTLSWSCQVCSLSFWLTILLWCKINVLVFSSWWWSYWYPIFQNLSSRSRGIKVVNFLLINMMHLFTSFLYPMSVVPLDFISRFIYFSMLILYMKCNFLSTYIYISMQSLFIS